MNHTYWIIGISATISTIVIAMLTFAYKYGKWQGEVDTDRANFNDFMTEVRSDIKQILIRLPVKPVESISSPIGLTNYGKELSEQIKALEIVEMQVDRVKDAVKGFNAYQIQEHCFAFCKNELMSELEENQVDRYNQIHEVAYKEGLDLEKLTRVIALELRDKILSSLSKPHTEIDQYSPD